MDIREERAEKITKYLVHYLRKEGKKQYFMVLEEEGKPIEFECHWKRKNARGVTFEAVGEAEAWVKQALLAGYTVFQSSRKKDGGGGRGLKNWPLPWDWDDERGCWDLDPESVERRRKLVWRTGNEIGAR